MTAMPISMGLPRQSLIFCRLLFRVMIFMEIFLLMASVVRPVWPAVSTMDFPAPPSTSPL